MEVYDNYIQWYDYFNSQIKPQVKKNVFNVDQIEEYLKLLYNEAESMIEDLRCKIMIILESDETQS